VEGLIVTISRVSPLILRKVGGAKTWFFWGEWVHCQPAPVKFRRGQSPPSPPVICTHVHRSLAWSTSLHGSLAWSTWVSCFQTSQSSPLPLFNLNLWVFFFFMHNYTVMLFIYKKLSRLNSEPNALPIQPRMLIKTKIIKYVLHFILI